MVFHVFNASETFNVTYHNTTYVIQVNDVKMRRLFNLLLGVLDLAVLVYILIVSLFNRYRKNKIGATKDETAAVRFFNAAKYVGAVVLSGHIAVQMPVVFAYLPNYCDVYNKVEYTCGAIVITLTYFVIWLRIYTLFYGNRTVGVDVSVYMRGFSIAAIVYFLVIALVNYILFMLAPSFITTEVGCLKLMVGKESYLPWLFFGATNAIFQVWIFFLLIYPMCLHSRRMQQHGIRSRNHIKHIRRATISTAICLALNICAVGVGLLLHSPLTYIYNVLISTILLAILVTLICTFDDWRSWFVVVRHPNAKRRKSNMVQMQTTSQGKKSGNGEELAANI